MKVSDIDGDWLLHYLEIYVLIFSATISILESWLELWGMGTPSMSSRVFNKAIVFYMVTEVYCRYAEKFIYLFYGVFNVDK